MQTNERQRPNAQPEPSFIQQIGHMLGRAIATVGAAMTMRIIGREVAARTRRDDQGSSLLREFQNELPVAATTLVTWNTEFGGETGAQVCNFLVENLRDLTTRYITTPVQNSHSQVLSFTERMAEALTSHIVTNVGQKFRGGAAQSPRLFQG